MPSLLDLAYGFMPEAPDQYKTIPPGVPGGWPRRSRDWGIGDEMRWQTAQAQEYRNTPMGGGGMPINAANWERFLAQQTPIPASQVEDRRGQIQPTSPAPGEGYGSQWPLMYPSQSSPMASALGFDAIGGAYGLGPGRVPLPQPRPMRRY